MLKITIDKHGDKYQVYLREGVQAFRVNYEGTKQESQWMARMLSIAVRRHNAELRRKYKPERTGAKDGKE